MNIIGKWKVKKVACLTPDGIEFCGVSDIPEGETAEEMRQLASSVVEFKEDGTVDTFLPVDAELLSEEDHEQMREEGLEIIDGFMKIESSTWEYRDGVPYYDTGTEGEILGEQVDSFSKIEFEGENMVFNCGMMLLEKM